MDLAGAQGLPDQMDSRALPDFTSHYYYQVNKNLLANGGRGPTTMPELRCCPSEPNGCGHSVCPSPMPGLQACLLSTPEHWYGDVVPTAPPSCLHKLPPPPFSLSMRQCGWHSFHSLSLGGSSTTANPVSLRSPVCRMIPNGKRPWDSRNTSSHPVAVGPSPSLILPFCFCTKVFSGFRLITGWCEPSFFCTKNTWLMNLSSHERTTIITCFATVPSNWFERHLLVWPLDLASSWCICLVDCSVKWQ